MQRYVDTVFRRAGGVIAPAVGVSVTVYTAAGAVATIYSDNAGTVTTNPLTTDSSGQFAFYAADGRYNIAASGAGITSQIRTDVLLEDSAGEIALTAWASAQAFSVVSATRNADGAVTTASIVWPDGTGGTYTADTLSTDYPGATDAWHATYEGAVTRTVTQAAITRDPDTGAVTAQPDLTIT